MRKVFIYNLPKIYIRKRWHFNVYLKYLCVCFSPARCISMLFFPINPMVLSLFSRKLVASNKQFWGGLCIPPRLFSLESRHLKIFLPTFNSCEFIKKPNLLFVKRDQQKINRLKHLLDFFPLNFHSTGDDRSEWSKSIPSNISSHHLFLILIPIDIFR